MAQPDQVCYKCGLPVGNRQWILASLHIWHLDCLKCTKCQLKLNHGQFVDKNDMIVCKNCAKGTAEEQKRCHACLLPMQEKGVLVHDYYFHRACFKCDSCKQPLPISNWYDKTDKVFCKVCYDCLFPTNCCRCQATLSGQILATPSGAYFCSKCFTCTNCRRTISSAQYFEMLDELYCIDCEMQFLNKKYLMEKLGVGAQG